MPTEREIRELVQEGEALAKQLSEEDLAQVPGGAAAAAGAAAGVPAMGPGGGGQWRAAANMQGFKLGDVVGLPAGTPIVGQRYAIAAIGDKHVFIEYVGEKEIDAFLGRAVENEARVLPLNTG
eukprot:5132091-Amphidinium_carterae.1